MPELSKSAKKFTYHIVNIKVRTSLTHSCRFSKFTYHIVNIKVYDPLQANNVCIKFTYHIVNIKVRIINKYILQESYLHIT